MKTNRNRMIQNVNRKTYAYAGEKPKAMNAKKTMGHLRVAVRSSVLRFGPINLLNTMFANKFFQLLRHRKTPYESAI
jgi:hypothetical protein